MSDTRIILGDPNGTFVDLTAPNGPFTVYASDTNFGNMVPITETVQSGLQDGTLVRWLRDDNREIVLSFGVVGSNFTALATAVENSIVPLTKINNLLTIYPGDAPPAVFEVWTSELEFVTDGPGEATRRRLYTLTLTAQPYARSLSPVTSPALAGGGGAPVTLDNGSSATGWTSTLGGSVTSSGGVLLFPLASLGSGVVGLQVSKTITSRNFTTTPYLYIDVKLPLDLNGNVNPPSVNLAGVSPGSSLTFVAAVPAPTTGYTRYWFTWFGTVPTAGTSLSFTFSWSNVPGSTTTVSADNVTCQGDPPVLGTNSPIRYITTAGSKRTPGSLRVNNCVLLYTSPRIGYQTYDPASILTGSAIKVTTVPVGSYVFVLTGKLAGSANATATVTTTIVQGSATKVVKKMITLDGSGNAVGTFPIGSVALPLLEVSPTSTDTMTATITVSGATLSTATFPGALGSFTNQWAFWMGKPGNGDQCALSIPKWPYSGPSVTMPAYTWFDAPTWDRPYPGVWAGTAADKSDAVNQVGSMERWGDHYFTPGNDVIFVVGGQADLTYYPRWHTWPVS